MPISETLLEQLRAYWRLYHPGDWLFPGRTPDRALSPTSVQKVYTRAKGKAGVTKIGGIHSLRHAYATHLLEAGLPVHRLQRHMGVIRTFSRCCAMSTGCPATTRLKGIWT